MRSCISGSLQVRREPKRLGKGRRPPTPDFLAADDIDGGGSVEQRLVPARDRGDADFAELFEAEVRQALHGLQPA